jgi:hypothetical protein
METRKGWRKNWIPWVKLKTSENFPGGLLPVCLVQLWHFAIQSHSPTKYSTSLEPTMTCCAYSCTQQDLHFKAFNATHVNAKLFCAGVFLWQIRYCWPQNWALVFADSSTPNDLKKLGLQMKIDVCCEATLRHFSAASNRGKTLRKLKRRYHSWQ